MKGDLEAESVEGWREGDSVFLRPNDRYCSRGLKTRRHRQGTVFLIINRILWVDFGVGPDRVYSFSFSLDEANTLLRKVR